MPDLYETAIHGDRDVRIAKTFKYTHSRCYRDFILSFLVSFA